MQANDVRPPYVEFKVVLVEDRAKSIETGRYSTKEVDYIIIVPAGSEGRTRIEQEYKEWLAKIRQQVGPKGGHYDGQYEVESRFNPDWVTKIENMYEAWKKGQTMDVEGSPLRNWPAISPGQLKVCEDLRLYTVEQLANAADDTIERIGMGAYNLRQRARDWLAALSGGEAKLSIELETLRSDVTAKDTRIKSLEEQIRGLQQEVQALSKTAQKVG